jgi:hypothetical protein
MQNAAGYSETSVHLHETARYFNPVHNNFHIYCRENPKFYVEINPYSNHVCMWECPKQFHGFGGAALPEFYQVLPGKK